MARFTLISMPRLETTGHDLLEARWRNAAEQMAMIPAAALARHKAFDPEAKCECGHERQEHYTGERTRLGLFKLARCTTTKCRCPGFAPPGTRPPMGAALGKTVPWAVRKPVLCKCGHEKKQHFKKGNCRRKACGCKGYRL